MKEIIIKELGIAEEIIHIVPLVERGDPTLQPDVVEEDNTVLFFGRIWEYKGLEYFIKAEPLVARQVPEARFVIAGRGDDLSPYERMMIHPENFIIYNEFVSYEKRAELFQQASVVVLPYIEATQSGVIPVAYTHGKPVIATEVGGLPAQIEHGQTGFLVPPRDEKALADKIVRLLRDKELRHRLGANARHKLESEWTAAAVAKKTMPVYEAAIRAVSQNGARKNTHRASTA
jgi:glycosyltransferase involved in cell wall biosynthesis